MEESPTVNASSDDLQIVFDDAANTSDVITLMLGAADPLAKSGAPTSKLFKAKGKKPKSRMATYYYAIQIHVPNVQVMAALLELVGSTSGAALCNGRFPKLPVYSLSATSLRFDEIKQKAFLIWPQNEVKKEFGFEKGVHQLRDGRYVVARTSANTLPTSWLLLDRDIKSTAPDWAKDANWLELMEDFIPGIGAAPRVETRSSSSRVTHDGVPLAVGHGHVWVQTAFGSAVDIKVARSAVRATMIVHECCWIEPDKNGKPQTILPLDLSTWHSCSMAYSGKPQVESGSGLAVGPAKLNIVNTTGIPCSLRDIPTPSPTAFEDAQRKMRPGTDIYVNNDYSVNIHDLTLNTPVELDDGSIITLGEVEADLLQRVAAGEISPKQRMQTPLRPDSRSVAAFAGLTNSGALYLCDSGLPGEKHFLSCPAEAFEIISDTPIMVSVAGVKVAEPAPQSVADAAPTQPTDDDADSAPKTEAEPVLKATVAQYEQTPIYPLAIAPVPPYLPALVRLRLLTAEDLYHMPPMLWLIKGLFPQRGIMAIYGPSGSGKSFLALSMLASIAAGDPDWHGYKCKPAPVVYVALEGEAGLSQRVKAYSKRHGEIPENMHFLISSLSLLDGNDTAALVRLIREAGGEGAVVCIDTLAQATPGSDENSSADMGRAIAACKKIQAQLNGLVVLVHHTGKQAGQGPRGHSSLFAALDAAIEVTRDATGRAFSIAKSKDGADGRRHAFELESVNLGFDEDGDPISSCVVIAKGTPVFETIDVPRSAQAALVTLIDAVAGSDAIKCPGGSGIQGTVWRRLELEKNPLKKKDSVDKAWRRARDELLKAGQIEGADDIFWPVKAVREQHSLSNF